MNFLIIQNSKENTQIVSLYEKNYIPYKIKHFKVQNKMHKEPTLYVFVYAFKSFSKKCVVAIYLSHIFTYLCFINDIKFIDKKLFNIYFFVVVLKFK